MLIESKCLVHFDQTIPIIVTADSSAYGIGAVLSHRIEGQERPIFFISRTLTETERRYSQIEKEALALIFSLRRFHYYLWGVRFEMVTDHKPLLGLFSSDRQIPQQASGRIQRWALIMQAYQIDLKHKSGKHIGNADALSRLPLSNQSNECVPIPAEWIFLVSLLDSTPVNAKQIAKWTAEDDVLAKVAQYSLEGWPIKITDPKLQPFHQRRDELSLEEGCILWGYRVIIPLKGQELILIELHKGHVGASRMKALARSYLWWPNLDKRLEDLSSNCDFCLEHRHTPPKTALHPWEWPTKPWARIHVDYAGPIQNNYYFVVLDAHSKWVEIFITRSITSASTISFLDVLFARWGYPMSLVSDNATSFRSEEFTKYMETCGIRHITSSVYHQSTNGAAENMVKCLKRGLQSHGGEGIQTKISIQSSINSLMSHYRTTPHTTTGMSPAELMLGRRIRTRLDLLRPDVTKLSGMEQKANLERVQGRVVKKQELQKKYYSKGTPRKISFAVSDKVMYRNYGIGPKWKSAVVKSLSGPVSFKIITEDGTIIKRHADQLWADKRQNKDDSDDDQEDDDKQSEESFDSAKQSTSNTSSLNSSDDEEQGLRRSGRTRGPPSRFNADEVEPRRSTRTRVPPNRLAYP